MCPLNSYSNIFEAVFQTLMIKSLEAVAINSSDDAIAFIMSGHIANLVKLSYLAKVKCQNLIVLSYPPEIAIWQSFVIAIVLTMLSCPLKLASGT